MFSLKKKPNTMINSYYLDVMAHN